jgi:hypothetical protein
MALALGSTGWPGILVTALGGGDFTGARALPTLAATDGTDN